MFGKTLLRKVDLFSSTGCRLIHNALPKAYTQIPGPKGFLQLGTWYKYLPLIGRYRWDALHEAGFEKYNRWGSVVRETMVPGVDVVWIFEPADVAKVFADSGPGRYPSRRSHLALEKYRKDRKHIYRTGGLLPTNGEEWWQLRSEVQKGLSSTVNVRKFLGCTDKITQEFLNCLGPKTVNNVPDMMDELSRLNLELLCLFVFDVRMNSFANEERHPRSRSSQLIHAAEVTNSSILPTDQGFQLWRYFETPAYKRLRRSQEYMERCAVDFVAQQIAFYEDEYKHDSATNSSRSLIRTYLNNPNLDLQDVVGMAADLLLAGVDTTTYTTCFLLYNLAINKRVQDKLYREVRNVVADEQSLQDRIPYTRAVLKESLRLNPISVGVGRNLNSDLVLSGYTVPKETMVVTQNFVACRLEKNFKRPLEFLPERWLKSSDSEPINPYLVLPFGHGMRACIARRLAEQNMLVLLIKIVSEFELMWLGSNVLNLNTHLINKPDQPVAIQLKRRQSIE